MTVWKPNGRPAGVFSSSKREGRECTDEGPPGAPKPGTGAQAIGAPQSQRPGPGAAAASPPE